VAHTEISIWRPLYLTALLSRAAPKCNGDGLQKVLMFYLLIYLLTVSCWICVCGALQMEERRMADVSTAA